MTRPLLDGASILLAIGCGGAVRIVRLPVLPRAFGRGFKAQHAPGRPAPAYLIRPGKLSPAAQLSRYSSASCGFTECLQAIDRHATAKQGIRD